MASAQCRAASAVVGDLPGWALWACCRDAEAAGVAHLLRLRNGPCETWQLPRRPALTITNPPWGRRLMERGSERRTRPAASERRGGERGNDMDGEADGEELVHTWKQLAKFFKVGLHNVLNSLLPSVVMHKSEPTFDAIGQHIHGLLLPCRASVTRRQCMS